jgi:hypothetical protein
VYVLDEYSFSEYGIEIIAMLIYSTIKSLKGCFGVVIIVDTHTMSMTKVYQEDGIAVGELLNLSKSVLLEERQQRAKP